MAYVKNAELARFTFDALTRCGLEKSEAEIAAEVLSYADSRGIDTHGIANLDSIYVHKLRCGAIDAKAKGRWLREKGAVALYDAEKQLGLVAAKYAMERSILLAEEFGIGCVVVKNSSHFGAAGYYAKMASDKNMIGLSMTNLGSQAIAKPLNSAKNLLGTNPISLAASAGEQQDFILDMSTTANSSGKIKLAARQGQGIPPGTLFNKDGDSVEDPNAYLDGSGHLAMLGGAQATGGYKGMGLAMLVDILCGCLSGADVGPATGEDEARDTTVDNNIGHFFLTINTPWLRDTGDFKRSMDDMLASMLQAPTFLPENEIIYPGIPEVRTAKVRASQGVPLDSILHGRLDALAETLSIPAISVI
ncbi:Ldh family oxidoreductase [Thalassomonas viridans]|nr:Ldh family oxidoreductase [Thalassomonas viridans]